MWLLSSTTAALLFVLLVQVTISQEFMVKSIRVAASIYLLAYTGTLIAGQLTRRQNLAGYAIVAIAAIELIHFNRISVGHRHFVTKSAFESRAGYNDETVDAVRDIKAQDESLFFRITKPRPAVITQMVGLNDALVYGYYSTSSYSSFNNANYTDFLTATGELVPNSESHTRWAIGTLNDPLLSTFAGEKYALVDDPAFLENKPAYRYVRQYGPNHLFVNELSMPLGVSFTHYIPEEQFLQLPIAARDAILFRAAVLREGETHGLQPLRDVPDTPVASVIAERRNHGLQLTSFRQSAIDGTIRLAEKSLLVVQTPFDRGWRAFANGEAVPVVKADVGLLGVLLPPGEHNVQLRYRNPYLLPGAALSAAAFLLVGFALWRWPRLPL